MYWTHTSDRSGRWSTTLLRAYLNDSDAAVDIVTADGETRYRIEADEPPPELEPTVDEYRAVAFLTQRGVVTGLEVEYYHEPSEEWAQIGYRYGNLDEEPRSPLDGQA